MLPPAITGPADDAPAPHIQAPPGFEARPCDPPPPPHGRCATPGCTRGVEEEGDTFCGACVEDFERAESHHADCPCGPCAVHAAALKVTRRVYSLPEFARHRAARAAESLSAYLARRDGAR